MTKYWMINVLKSNSWWLMKRVLFKEKSFITVARVPKKKKSIEMKKKKKVIIQSTFKQIFNSVFLEIYEN